VSKNILGGRYRVTEKVGAGGMADVYKAIDETLGRTVAVKVMHTKYASDPTFTQRFRQEAQAAANLQSPNIVNIYDWGQEGNFYYIVMEYVRGTDLKSIIRQKGPLTSRQVAEIGTQISSALTTAHGYDIIHRDVKPHNVMVTPDGMVKVMDFGIARAGNTSMTQTGSVLGTAHYVSPEQAQGRDITNASDLYSLGVVLYEAATGRVPFDGDTPVAVALKQVNEQAQRPSNINKAIDPRLEDIIGRAMAKDPRTRYATADDMRKDLQRIIDGSGPLDATTVLSGPASGMGLVDPDDATMVLPGNDGSSTTVMPSLGGRGAGHGPGDTGDFEDDDFGKPKKRTWVNALIVILALLLLGGAIYYALSVYEPTPKGIDVPKVTGLTVDAAREKLVAEGLRLGTTSEKYDPKVEAGKIISQNPKEGDNVEEGTAVNVVVSLGQEMGVVPDLFDLSEAAAKDVLREAGYEPDPQPAVYNASVTAGNVISQDPEAGSSLALGEKVSYIPSLGAEVVGVPSVLGMDIVTAENTLIAAGFTMATLQDYSDTVAEGLVISQNPAAEVRVEKGSSVTVMISLGPKIKDVTIPDVIGVRAGTAQTLLQNAGLTSTITYKKTNNTGNVVAQNPGSGGVVPEGTSISLTVDADGPE